MKKNILVLFALTIFLFVFADSSSACTCTFLPEPVKKQVKNAYSISTAIFEGKVLELIESNQGKFAVKFKVSKSWKGEQSNEIIISTLTPSSMCGYRFKVGKTYLVYARASNQGLQVGLCSRTSGLVNNGDLKYLSKLKPQKPNRK